MMDARPGPDKLACETDPHDEGRLHRGPGRVIGCVVHTSCYTTAPGCISLVMGKGLLLGEARGGGRESVDEVADLLTRAVDSIQREVFCKLRAT